MNEFGPILLAGALWLAAEGPVARAQVSLYDFSTSVQDYTEIAEEDAAYSLGQPTWSGPFYNDLSWVNNDFFHPRGQSSSYLNAATGPGYPIGFPFTYNGDVFDVIGISNSGWISFGKSSDGNQAVWTYAISHPHGRPFVQYIGGPSVPYKRNRIAGWGSEALYMRDHTQLVPPGSVTSLRVATTGTAPNRVFVVQFKDFLAAYPGSESRVNFQIRLYEADNAVEVRYGQIIFNTINDASVQVGLGGRVPEDFNSRKVVFGEPAFLYDWNNTEPGQLNTDGCYATAEQPGHPNGSGIPPVVGRTFRWAPSSCMPPAWPIELVSSGLGYYELQWPAVPGAVSYDYVVTTGSDPEAPSPVAEGSVEEPFAVVEGLDTLTTYHIHVRSVCAGGAGPWGLPTVIRSAGGAILECGEQPIEQYHCYAPVETNTWHYFTSDGTSPIRVLFTGGSFTSGSRFRVFNGPDTTAAVLWDSNTGGVLSGRSFVTDGPALTLKMTGHATAGCSNVDFLHPIEWTLGCKDCTDPLVNFVLGEVDCDAGEYYADVDVFSMGSATELSLQNDLGLAPLLVNTTGVHTVGPFPAGQPVVITAANPANSLCDVVAPALVNEPCPILDCGPTWYEVCLDQAEVRTWLFQGDGQPVGVRFLPGPTGFDARIRSYDGPDELSPQFPELGSFAGVNNEVRQSTNDDHQLLVQYAASQFGEYSCALGNMGPLRFVVGCPDGCEQPAATFAYADCIEAASFNIVVNVTSLGSAASVRITNDGGAPVVTATEAGSYTVGPFPSESIVRVHVEGANELCTWSSQLMSRSCLDISVAERVADPIRLAPNPTDGSLRVGLPAAFQGAVELLVLDVSGRVAGRQTLNASGEVALDLTHLPDGLYTLILQDGVQRAAAKVSIQH